MSNEAKNPNPPAPYVGDGSLDAAVIVAINEQHRRGRLAANASSMVNSSPVPASPPPPGVVYDGSADAALIGYLEAHRRQRYGPEISSGPPIPGAPWNGATEGSPVPEQEFPVLVSQAVLVPYEKTSEGQLVRAATLPLLAIIRKILEDPSRMYEIDPRKWEEVIAATYEASGLFDEVTLTHRSGDGGRDLIAVKKGFGSVRLIESVKRYTPGRVVTAEQVQALLGVFLSDPQATKGIISTTWEFAPRIKENSHIMQYVPHRLEMLTGMDLLKRFEEYTSPKSR